MSSVFIYGLCEPETGEIRYVGSSTTPKRRLTNHLSGFSSVAVGAWVDELGERGLRPMLVILDEVDGETAASKEAAFIEQLSRPRLLNERHASLTCPLVRPPLRPRQERKPSIGAVQFRAELRRRGWTMNECARRLGLSSGLVSRWASGARVPCRDMAAKLFSVMGIRPSEWSMTEAA